MFSAIIVSPFGGWLVGNELAPTADGHTHPEIKNMKQIMAENKEQLDKNNVPELKQQIQTFSDTTDSKFDKVDDKFEKVYDKFDMLIAQQAQQTLLICKSTGECDY